MGSKGTLDASRLAETSGSPSPSCHKVKAMEWRFGYPKSHAMAFSIRHAVANRFRRRIGGRVPSSGTETGADQFRDAHFGNADRFASSEHF